MAKVIKVDIGSQMDSIVEEFKKALTTSKLANGKFTFTHDFGTVEKKATLIYSTKAWLKTKVLVDHFSSEVAWHGFAHRVDGEENTYKIEDLEVYPQEVTGATVTTDQEEYTKWLYAHTDEEFNSIRAQCHSHVNMGVSPSGTDETLYRHILGQLSQDDFYIFTIHNKKGDMTRIIYDLRDNLSFDNKDIDVVVEGLEGFVAEADSQVKKHVYTNTGSTGSGYPYGGYRDGYGYYDYGGTSGYTGYQGGYSGGNQQRGGAPANTGKVTTTPALVTTSGNGGKPAPGSVTPAGKGDQGQRFGYKKK